MAKEEKARCPEPADRELRAVADKMKDAVVMEPVDRCFISSVACNQVGLGKMPSTKQESPVLPSLYVTAATSLVLSGIFLG